MLLLEEPQASLVVAVSGLEGILRQRPLRLLLPLVVGQAGCLPESKLPTFPGAFSALPSPVPTPGPGLTWWCWAPHRLSQGPVWLVLLI